MKKNYVWAMFSLNLCKNGSGNIGYYNMIDLRNIHNSNTGIHSFVQSVLNLHLNSGFMKGEKAGQANL